MITKTVEVTTQITVTVDESMFDEDFMREYKEAFYPFHSLEDHLEHLAQLKARGHLGYIDPFIEGYGLAATMGISFDVGDTQTEITD